MKLYNIYWTDSYGDKSLQATTNNCEKWLENNNEERPPCPECDGEGTHIYEGKKEECDYCEGTGNDDESLDDFEIEEADAYIYEEKQDPRCPECEAPLTKDTLSHDEEWTIHDYDSGEQYHFCSNEECGSYEIGCIKLPFRHHYEEPYC